MADRTVNEREHYCGGWLTARVVTVPEMTFEVLDCSRCGDEILPDATLLAFERLGQRRVKELHENDELLAGVIEAALEDGRGR